MAGVLTMGTVVAGYRVDRVLGEGGMGVVYEATQLSLERKVALKIVASGLSADSAFRARFRREGQIQASLEHPNIGTVYEAGEEHGLLFLAMRLIHGTSLKAMIRAGGLDAPRTLRILSAVADALDHAHDAGLIHRDVKPHNILVNMRDCPYLADFGITKGVNDTGLTRTGQFMGSLDYVAPEQVRGERITGACDIYALGAVLVECLTGTVPFVRDTEAALLYAHVEEPPPKISDLRPDLPDRLDEVIAKAMAKKPEERPATAAALILSAGECFVEGAVPAINPAPFLEKSKPVSLRPVETRAGTITLPDHELPPGSGDEPNKRRPLPGNGSSDVPGADPLLGSGQGLVSPKAPGGRVVSAESRRREWSPLVNSLLLVASLVLLLAMIGAGYIVGYGLVSSSTSSRPSRTVRSGVASITLPGRWQGTTAPSLPGLDLQQMTAVRSSSGDVLALGLLPDATGRRLLPTGFADELGAQSAKTDAVRLGSASAYRYRLRPRGLARALTLMVVPTTAGVIGVLCLARSSVTLPAAWCEAAAGTLRLMGAKPLPLGPSPKYAQVLSRVVAKAGSVSPVEHALSGARTRGDQARFSVELARIWDSVARLLAMAHPDPDAAVSNARLRNAVGSAAREYSAMADTARRGDSARFRDAGIRELSAQHDIRASLESLRDDGYP